MRSRYQLGGKAGEVTEVTEAQRNDACPQVFDFTAVKPEEAAAVSCMAVAGAGGAFLITDSVMTVAMACVMVVLRLLYGTQATTTRRLRIRGQSRRKQRLPHCVSSPPSLLL